MLKREPQHLAAKLAVASLSNWSGQERAQTGNCRRADSSGRAPL
jgi:hypothetical protein